MNFKRLGGAVIPFHRPKEKGSVLSSTSCVRETSTGGPEDAIRTDSTPQASVTPPERSYSPQHSGGECESTPHAISPASGSRRHGPTSPFVLPRRQYSVGNIAFALFVAIVMVWLAIVAVIAAGAK